MRIHLCCFLGTRSLLHRLSVYSVQAPCLFSCGHVWGECRRTAGSRSSLVAQAISPPIGQERPPTQKNACLHIPRPPLSTQAQAQQSLEDLVASGEEVTALRRGLADSERTVEALTARVATLQEAVESQRAALENSEACLSAAEEVARRSAASLQVAAADGDLLKTELAALRELAGGATQELREELALLRAQVDGAERTATELKEEATAAAAVAAEARASQAAAAGEAAAAAEEAARRHAADLEVIEALRARADAAGAAWPLVGGGGDGGDGNGGGCGGGGGSGRSPTRRPDGGERLPSRAAFERALERELDSIARCSAEAAVIVARAGWASPEGGGGGVAVEAGRGAAAAAVAEEEEEREVGGLVKVARQAVAGVEALREALAVAEENVSLCAQTQVALRAR